MHLSLCMSNRKAFFAPCNHATNHLGVQIIWTTWWPRNIITGNRCNTNRWLSTTKMPSNHMQTCISMAQQKRLATSNLYGWPQKSQFADYCHSGHYGNKGQAPYKGYQKRKSLDCIVHIFDASILLVTDCLSKEANHNVAGNSLITSIVA